MIHAGGRLRNITGHYFCDIWGIILNVVLSNIYHLNTTNTLQKQIFSLKFCN